MRYTIELFQHTIPVARGRMSTMWYFRIVARNGKIIAQSEGYLRYAACRQIVTHLVDPTTEFDVIRLGEDDK